MAAKSFLRHSVSMALAAVVAVGLSCTEQGATDDDGGEASSSGTAGTDAGHACTAGRYNCECLPDGSCSTEYAYACLSAETKRPCSASGDGCVCLNVDEWVNAVCDGAICTTECHAALQTRYQGVDAFDGPYTSVTLPSQCTTSLALADGFYDAVKSTGTRIDQVSKIEVRGAKLISLDAIQCSELHPGHSTETHADICRTTNLCGCCKVYFNRTLNNSGWAIKVSGTCPGHVPGSYDIGGVWQPGTCVPSGSCLSSPCCEGTSCVDFGTTAECLQDCAAAAQCASGCCYPLSGGGSVCVPAEYCASCAQPNQPCYPATAPCCPGAACVWVEDVGARCQAQSAECPAGCTNPYGSICCRPPYCAGDCVGSPCCN